jgi:hypothetical protein
VQAHQALISGETLAADLVVSESGDGQTSATVGQGQHVGISLAKV